MSETQASHGLVPEEDGGQSRAPHRVIGTPPPAQARTLLGEAPGSAEPEAPRELPAGPDNPAKAKTADKVVAACFLLSMLASFGFIAAYVGLQVHSVDGTLRSNLALGLSMSVAFMAMGVGATIWVRSIMPDVEQVEQRHPLAGSDEEREAFAKTFTEGAEASGFVKRPLLRRTLIAASVPLAVAPLVLLRDMGPLPGTSLRHTVWRRGTRMVVYGPNTPLRAADFSIPGQMITVAPEGFTENQDVLAKAVTIIIKFAPGPARAEHAEQAGHDHELDRGRHRRLLQDLHPRGLPGRRSTSRRPTTSCARATSPRSTRPRAPRCCSGPRHGRCRSSRSGLTRTGS